VEIDKKNRMKQMMDYRWEDDAELAEMETDLEKHKASLAIMAALLTA
jgi:hypothetical protein